VLNKLMTTITGTPVLHNMIMQGYPFNSSLGRYQQKLGSLQAHRTMQYPCIRALILYQLA